MPSTMRHFYEFGPFRLDPQKHRLFKDGKPVHVSSKALETLSLFVQNPGKMLEREALMRAVWSDSFVEDANLTVAVSQLRKALGQDGDAAEYIETLPRVGYRFVADVREVREEPNRLLIEKRTLSQTVIEEELVNDGPDVEQTAQSVGAPKLAGRSVSRRVVASLLVLALVSAVALGAVLYSSRAQPPQPPDNAAIASIRSIAVLPPKSLGEKEESASLSLGLADALITRLGSVQKLSVRPTSAIVRYSDGNQDPVNAGRSLGVDAVLDGTLQRGSEGVRVTLRLINVASGMQLWSGHFDEGTDDIFKLQDRVVKQVGEALLLDISPKEEALLTKQQTTNSEAYVLYLKGNYFWSRRGPNAVKGAEYFRKAIELDPNFAQAYAALAAVDSTASLPSPEAEALIGRALQLDPSLAAAHATYAFIRMFHHWDWSTAEQELDRAIELDPNSSTAHHWKAVYLSLRGRLDEAKAEMHRALEQDPLSPVIVADLGQLHYFAREYDQAIDFCNQALALDSNFRLAREYLVDIYRAKGMDQEGFDQWIRIWNPDEQGIAAKKRELARSGLRGIFKQELDAELSRNPTQQAFVIARNYLRLGENEEGLRWLEIVFKNSRTHWHPYLNVDPLYDNVRAEPRFKALLHRMNLP